MRMRPNQTKPLENSILVKEGHVTSSDIALVTSNLFEETKNKRVASQESIKRSPTLKSQH